MRKYFEIKNIGWFFVSLIILIVGTLIVIFDYPQLQYFENLGNQSYFLLDKETRDFHDRLKIEFSIGLVFVLIGMIILVSSLFFSNKRK